MSFFQISNARRYANLPQDKNKFLHFDPLPKESESSINIDLKKSPEPFLAFVRLNKKNT